MINIIIIILEIITFIELIICLYLLKYFTYLQILKKKFKWFLPSVLETKDEDMISSKEYKDFINLLSKHSVFILRKNKKDSKKRDIRINEYLVYRVKNKIQDRKIIKVAQFHIRSNPPDILKEVFNARECIDTILEYSKNILNNSSVSEVECITHNRLISNYLYEKQFKPMFKEGEFEVNFKEYDKYDYYTYLTGIYCQFILAHGVKALFTIRGYRELKRINKVVKFTVKKI